MHVHCTVLYYTILYCTVRGTVLYCTILYCTVWYTVQTRAATIYIVIDILQYLLLQYLAIYVFIMIDILINNNYCNNWPRPLTTSLFSCQHGGYDCFSSLFKLWETALHKVRRYMYDAEDHEMLDMKEQLKQWNLREQQYMYMYIYIYISRLVKRTLCITASSVPSERLFSSAGNLVNQKRSCLSPDNVVYFLFL